MPQQLTRLTVFISCPNDLSAEKKVVASVIQELNRSLGESHHILLNAMMWETDVIPGLGADAQSVINAQISGKYDIYIGLLGSRFGSKTPRAESGTQEEFDIAYERYHKNPDSIRVLFYFKTTPHESIYKIALDQLQKVIDFRQKLGAAGGLYFDFANADDLFKVVSDHLRKLITEQWDGTRWKVLSPLPTGHLIPVVPSGTDLGETRNVLDHPSDEDSDSAGFLDFIVTAESALDAALKAIMNIGSFTERSTEETNSTIKKLNTAVEQKNAREMKNAINHLSMIMSKHSSDLRRELTVLEGSLNKAFVSTETALKMYSEDQLGDPSQLKGLAESLTPFIVSLRGSREMADEMQKTMGSLPGYTRDFKAALRQTRQVYSEMSATMTVLLGRTMTAQENFERLTRGQENPAKSDTQPISSPDN